MFYRHLAQLCRAFQAWADKTCRKKTLRQKLLNVSQLFMHGSLARCFQAWHQEAQVYNAPVLMPLLHPAVTLIQPVLQLNF